MEVFLSWPLPPSLSLGAPWPKILIVFMNKIRTAIPPLYFTQPPFSLVRFVGQILVGNSWSFLIAAAVPEEEILGISLRPLVYLAPLGTALGEDGYIPYVFYSQEAM